MKNKSKIIGIVLGAVLFIMLAVGLTYAVYTWTTTDEENKDLEGSGKCFNIVYTKGANIGSNENLEKIDIGSSYKDGLSTTVKMKIDSSCNISGKGTIYLNTTEVSDILLTNNILNYYVSSGTKGIVNSRDPIIIYDNFDVTSTEKSITVYLWISGENVDSNNLEEILSSTYKGYITAKVESR